MELYKFTFTASQVDNLIEFFELEFIPSIKRNEELDNINYLVDMCDIFRALVEAKEGVDD